MDSTRHSLLDRLKQPQPDNEESWRRFIELYTPLLFQWAMRLSVPYDDRSDLVQNTLAKLLVSISTFNQDSPGRFRGWLLAVLRNTWIDSQRKRNVFPTYGPGTDPETPNPLEATIECEYRQYMLNRIQELVLRDFPETTQLVFQQYVLENRPASEVAIEFGMTVNAIYLVRTRILKRIREELSGLID